MPKQDQQLLLFLALQAGLHGKAKTSTAKIASHFRISQQTASRKLRDLKKAGLIELNASPSGCTVALARPGAELLRSSLSSLQQLFRGKKKASLQGIVKTGLGEGRYYVSRPPYLKQFRKLLGFKPFLGTLNIAVEPDQLSPFISGQSPVTIAGFKTDERSFGKIKAFKVLVEGKQQAFLIFPERTAHPRNEIEIIAPVNLRKKFRLREGSKVSLQRA